MVHEYDVATHTDLTLIIRNGGELRYQACIINMKCVGRRNYLIINNTQL